MGDAPSGTLTFLLTDVEDSTGLWDRNPAGMREALVRHDRIVADAMAAHDGHVFTTAGDSFAAAFSTAEDAANAACEVQLAISAATWPSLTEIAVRIGLHTGEAEERNSDYFGPAVNLAARIAAAGHGGQILVSEVTARLLGASAASDWQLDELGEHRLKGFRRPERLHQIVVPGLRRRFGALRAEPTSTTNLTGPPPDLVGRDIELDDLVESVRRQRMVTVTGIGGVGKTSIAVAAATRLIDEFDEVWLVELAPVEMGGVTMALATVLNIAGTPNETSLIAPVLARRGSMLLLLDNCEHVIDEVADLAQALLTGGTVSILATSRVELEIPTESVARLAPFSDVTQGIALFVRAAQRHRADFELDPATRESVERICTEVAGIPLAIELAAARTRSLDPIEILGRLTSLLGQSTRGSHIDDRHRTMAAAIDWSIDLLSDDLLAALRGLTVFGGTFDLRAADAVVSVVADIDAVEALDELVAQSLVEATRTEVGMRYRLLEPIRQRVAHVVTADDCGIRDAHLEHYLDRLEEAYAELATRTCEPVMSLVFHDLDNLRDVHRWALESGRISDDLRLYRPLMFAVSHEVFEPGEWAVETLQLSDIENQSDWELAVMAAAVFRAHRGGSEDRFMPYVDRLFALVETGTAGAALRAVYAWFKSIAWGDHDAALPVWDALELEDPWVTFLYYWHASTAHRVAGASAEEVQQHFTAGIEWARSIGARNFEAGLLERAALHYLGEQEWSECRRHADLAVSLADDTRMGFFHDRAREHLARVMILAEGDVVGAAGLLDEVLDDAIAAGNEPVARLALETCAELLYAADLVHRAALAAGMTPLGQNRNERRAAVPVPDDLLEDARRRIHVEGLNALDVAAEVRDDLRSIASSASGSSSRASDTP